MAQSRRRSGPLGALRANRAASRGLEPEILHDDRRGLWIAILPASSFIQQSVDERRPGCVDLFGADRWTGVDALVISLIALFYGSLGYVLWQLSLR